MLNALKNTISSASILLLLSACTTVSKFSNYGSYKTGSKTSSVTKPGYFKCADKSTNVLQLECRYEEANVQSLIFYKAYENAAIGASKQDRWTQNGLLVGGAASAAMFLFESDPGGISKSVQDNLAGIGLAAAVISSYRSSVNATQKFEYLSNARKASICVIRYGELIKTRGLENEALFAADFQNALDLLVNFKSLEAQGNTDPKLPPLIAKIEQIVQLARQNKATYRRAPDEMMAGIDEINHQVHNGLKGAEITLAGVSETIFKAGKNSGKFAETKKNDVQGMANSLTPTAGGVRGVKSLVARGGATSIPTLFNSLINMQVNIEDTATPYTLLKACAGNLVGQAPPEPEIVLSEDG